MILQAIALVKEYRHFRKTFAAVDHVSFDLREGSFTTLMGQSGCGKSTLFHLLTGMVCPTAGKVVFRGNSLTHMSAGALSRMRRTEIGYVLQGQNLLQNFTVGENVCMPAFLGGMDKDTFNHARKLLDEFGLGDMEGEMPDSLSGGEQRRVAIARAFIHHPKLIIADEPTSNLDDRNAELILTYFKKATRRGVTVLISSHNRDAVAYSDNVWRMEHGRLAPV